MAVHAQEKKPAPAKEQPKVTAPSSKPLTGEQMNALRQAMQQVEAAQQQFDQADLVRYRAEEQLARVKQSAGQVQATIQQQCGGRLQQQGNTLVCVVEAPAKK